MTPPWDKGIQPISRDSYWNAVECGKQGGARPACVFYDAELCKNDDFTLAMFTPYKSVAYEVWRVIRNGQPAPTPSYGEAQRTRVTSASHSPKGSKNTITGLVIKRGGKTIEPTARALDTTGGKFSSTSRRSRRPPRSPSRSPARRGPAAARRQTVLTVFR